MGDFAHEVGGEYRRQNAVKLPGLRGVGRKIGEAFLAPGRWVDENIADPIRQAAAQAQGAVPAPSPEPAPADPEAQFRQWYDKAAMSYGLPPDPDRADYDYRAAFQAGVRAPTAQGWPAQFRRGKFQ